MWDCARAEAAEGVALAGSPGLPAPGAPQVLKASNGMTVWLVERHALPLISARLVVPAGSAVDRNGGMHMAFTVFASVGEHPPAVYAYCPGPAASCASSGTIARPDGVSSIC